MIISIIAALGNKNVIGKKNGLPWYLPADLKHFKEKTLGKPVIMGRTTYESIGRLLPERTNIILSKDKDFKVPGAYVVKSVEEALRALRYASEVMVIGGASIYGQFLPIANKLYLTKVYADFEGDVHFPEFDLNEWQETDRLDHKADDKNPHDYSFLTFSRK